MDRERIGKYQIVGELGRGTMGEVYKARDPVLNRFVALKTLGVRAASGGETLQRFQREAQAAAVLNHPNIVTVHDFGEEHGLLYMAMELLEGTDLRDAIDNELLKTLEEKLDVMDAVLAALDYAHARGVVHRDVKPANIHIGPGRRVKIMDFGLARVSTSEMTQEGIVLGTPNYMSPEQALGDRVDGRSDLFSTGAVLYELLTGHKPFEADSTPSVLFQVVHRQPPPVRRWAPNVPGGIVAVVNRSLEKDREKRFASAGDMRAAIAIARQALAPAASKAPPLPPLRPAQPPPLPPTAAPTAPPRSVDAAAPPVLPRPRVPTPQPMPSPPALRPSPPTLPPGSALPSGRPTWRPLAVGAGVAGLGLAAAAIGLWLRGRGVPVPAPSPSAASASVSALTHELVRKQVQLAQRGLEDKNYAAAAAEPSARLNGVFRAPADEAAAAMRSARSSAVAARVPAEALRAPTPAPPLTSAATPAGTPPPAPEPTATPLPGRTFTAEAMAVSTPAAGGIEGFDSSDVSRRRPPQFVGRMEFEVLPAAVRPGEPFVVRIHLRNDGRRAVKIRGVSLASVVDGQRNPAPVKPLQREVPAQSRALVAEYSGVWGEAQSWALEAVVTAERNETAAGRLRAN